jgi:hypothetical protein
MDRPEVTNVSPVEPEYEKPQVIDYGSLLELTKSGHVLNRDVPGGAPNTAFS